MSEYKIVDKHNIMICIKCKKQLSGESVTPFTILWYCSNEKCSRFGLFTIHWIVKYVGKHFPKFIKAIKIKKSI